MCRKRQIDRRKRLIQHRDQTAKNYDGPDRFLRMYDPKRRFLKDYDDKIQKCETKIQETNGLLQNYTK
ncbi:MAG: hypothetical protein OEX77_05865 [Candidatus Bathyarchaeota archaeon]|nr:hypothetical protein [Candidatus Bathyarchaeota archaeon]MDH5733986.1 hypothetical protein [Candidatus Bathyarchaeota archaeon]